MFTDRQALPYSWELPSIEEVTEVNPRLDKTRYDDELIVSFVPMPAVTAETGEIDTSELRKFSSVKKGFTPFMERDILFAKITPCMENGKMTVVPPLQNDVAFGSTEFHVLRPNTGILPEYIYYFVSSKLFRVEAEHNMSGAVGQRRVPTPWLKGSKLPLPPTNEQKRIVEKIEELFTELDKGVESLKKAREQLKVYRQALLKQAFEGKLTEQWRKDNPDKLEPVEQLIERIKQQREDSYQKQLENWKASVQQWETTGKEGKRPTKPRRLKLPEPVEEKQLTQLPVNPESWIWVKLGTLTWSVKDGPHYSPKYSDSGIPFISGGNIRPTGVDFENVKYISEELHSELCKRCKPELGDILYTKGGTTGIARVNTYERDFNVWVHVAVLKLVESVDALYLQHVLNSSFPYSQSQRFTHGVGNQDLGLTRMVNIIIPICSKEEQSQIVQEIENSISALDRHENEIGVALIQSETLRQSILIKAFSGELVTQDHRDEPASLLLERIVKEKTNL